MIMLRGSPSSDSSSQHTLLTPYRSGAGTPEDEEELALLQHLERLSKYHELPQEQPPQETGAHDWGRHGQAGGAPPHPQMAGGGWAGEHPPEEGAGHAGDEGPAWAPPGQVPASRWQPEQPDEDGDLAGGASATHPADDLQQGAWRRPAAGGEGQPRDAQMHAHALAWPPPPLPPPGPGPGGSGSHAWQDPQTMAPPARPAFPPSASGRGHPVVSEPPADASQGGAHGRPAPRPGAGREQSGRDDRGGRARSGLDILGQPAPAPRQQAPAKAAEDQKLKPYYQLGRGGIPRDANVVVLYNKKAPVEVTPFGALSNGTTFEEHGMEVLNDHSGNASANPRMIDISDPGWIRKLDALVQKHGKFAHVFVIDHGTPGSVSFGKHPGAYPEFVGMGKDSAPVSVIASVLADKGALHLGSCLTGNEGGKGKDMGLQYLKELRKTMDRGNHISIDAITGFMYNRLNQFDGRLIRVP